jgi:hypothetical protein
MGQAKKILVLSRRDPEEAMRVAAGMTIFGHQVRLVFMDRPVSEDVATGEQAELLELAGIEPETTVAAMAEMLPVLEATDLADAIDAADSVVNL